LVSVSWWFHDLIPFQPTLSAPSTALKLLDYCRRGRRLKLRKTL
jgi:hypothetical protein